MHLTILDILVSIKGTYLEIKMGFWSYLAIAWDLKSVPAYIFRIILLKKYIL